jgi:hypothetical protein
VEVVSSFPMQGLHPFSSLPLPTNFPGKVHPRRGSWPREVPDGRCARKERPAWDGMAGKARQGSSHYHHSWKAGTPNATQAARSLLLHDPAVDPALWCWHALSVSSVPATDAQNFWRRYPNHWGAASGYSFVLSLGLHAPLSPCCDRGPASSISRPLFSSLSHISSSGLSSRSLVTQKSDAPFFQDNAAQKYDPPPSGGKTSGAKTNSGCLDDFLATVEGRHRQDLACRIYRSSCFCTSSHH